jgi:hypothetical protein
MDILHSSSNLQCRYRQTFCSVEGELSSCSYSQNVGRIGEVNSNQFIVKVGGKEGENKYVNQNISKAVIISITYKC